MPREIIIEVDDDGNLELRAEGYKGKGCKTDSKFIEEALGMEDGNGKELPEYYATEIVKQKQKV